MAVVPGSITSFTDFTGTATNFSHNFDVGGANVLIAVVITNQTGTQTISPMTYNGVAMTLLGQIDNTSNSSPTINVFSLISPASGSNAIAGTFSTTPGSYKVHAFAMTGADTASLTGATSSSQNTLASMSETLTTDTAGSILLHFASWRDVFNNPSPDVTPGTGMTELLEEGSGTDSFADNIDYIGKRDAATVASYTTEASRTAAERAASITIEFHVGATGGGPTLPIFDHHYRMMRAA